MFQNNFLPIMLMEPHVFAV